MHFLTCSKLYVSVYAFILVFNLYTGYSERPNEVEQFFSNPHEWLSDYYSSHADLPTHLIMFDSLLPVTLISYSCMHVCISCMH